MALKLARRKILILLVLLLAGSAGGGWAYYHYVLNRQASEGTLVLYGNVDIREADLAFNSEGKVETMLVEEGDRVKPGQLLATLDASRYEAAVDADKAKIAAQRAVLDRLLAGSRPEEIKKARADVRAIEAELRDARANLKRTIKLVRDKFAPRQQLDADQARVNTLEAQLKAAQQTLSLAIAGPRAEDIAQARAELRAEEAVLVLDLERLKDTKLYAMDDGIVKTRIMEPGAVVLAHTPVYTIALIDPVWARTYVPEPDLGSVRPGMKAEVFTDFRPDKPYQGWVGFISPVAEFTPKTVETPEVRTSLVYRLRVYVKNPDESLRQGMPVTVKLLTETSAEGSGAGSPGGK